MVELVEAFEKQPEPPCTGCALYDACAQQQLACRHFAQYVGSVDTGGIPVYSGTREPTGYLYTAIHRDETPGPKGPVTPLSTLKAIAADETSTQRALASKFKVSTSTVRRAQNGYYDDQFV